MKKSPLLFYMLPVTIVLLIMSASLAETVLTLIIGAVGTISGWAAYAYTYLSDKPKVKGKILQVMKGNMQNPMQPSERLTSFILFLYLTNGRKNAIHLSNYILEIDVGNGFEQVKMLRGISDNLNIHFSYSKGGEIQIPDFN